MMDGNPRTSRGIFSLMGTRSMMKKRRVIVGLKPDNCGREMLLRLLNVVVVRGDSVVAVHVQMSEHDHAFDPNTFHIHEDICKSKQVDFEVKICCGSCYITELSHQVRLKFATILAIGGGSECPEDSTIGRFLKALPHTCTLVVMDNGGKILFQKLGTSQQGSGIRPVLRSFMSSPTPSSYPESSRPPIRKFLSMPPTSSAQTGCPKPTSANHDLNHFSSQISHRVTMLELKGRIRRFTLDELDYATDGFTANALIEERGNSKVYQAIIGIGGLAAAVKVLKASLYSVEYVCREVEMLSGLKHENIVQLLGYCCCYEFSAIVYRLPDSTTLKRRLKQLIWSERMKVAVGLAKALEFLHSSYPPIIHRDVKPSNIFLSGDCKPKLSDFGAAAVCDVLQTGQETTDECEMPHLGTETSGYMAPEYMMYGKVDEKIDVYSYGVVILELITGKQATSPVTSPGSSQECSALSARSLLNSCGLSERLIDPSLLEDYNEDEKKTLMVVSRLCLLHSSSRRPKMKTILRLLEEPEYWSEMRKMRDDQVRRIGCKYHVNSDPVDFLLVDDE